MSRFKWIPVGSIPTISDRFARLETIAESWGLLGQKDQAEYIMKLAFDIVKQMSAVEADRRLSMLVQAAYKISPDLAEEFASTPFQGSNPRS